MAERSLSGDFVNELLHSCLVNERVMLLVRPHLRKEFLPTDEHQEIWELISTYYDANGRVPTPGILAESIGLDKDVLKVYKKIKETEVVHKEDILNQFQEFIQRAIFINEYPKLADKFNNGSPEEAREAMMQIGEQMGKISLTSNDVDELWSGLKTDLAQNAIDYDNGERVKKIPTGIRALDSQLDGGLFVGDIAAYMAPSGGGKSKLLKFIGYELSRRGFSVLHIQAEGTHEQAKMLYQKSITTLSGSDIFKGEIPKGLDEELDKLINHVVTKKKGKLFLKTYEQFDTCDMNQIRNTALEIIDENGPLDVIIVDYIELIDPGDGLRYTVSQDQEQARRLNTINKFKNLCVELKMVGHTALQSKDLKPEEINDEESHITRHHIEKFKLIVKPLSLFVTVNRSEGEIEEETLRLYIDKYRDGIDKSSIPIATSYGKERFYNHKRTIEEFPDNFPDDDEY